MLFDFSPKAYLPYISSNCYWVYLAVVAVIFMIEPILIVDLSEYLEDSIFLLYLTIVRDGVTAL